MGWRDKLFGKRPKGLGGIEDSVQGLGTSLTDAGRVLSGGERAVTVCPTCQREVVAGSDVCPLGHRVG